MTNKLEIQILEMTRFYLSFEILDIEIFCVLIFTFCDFKL